MNSFSMFCSGLSNFEKPLHDISFDEDHDEYMTDSKILAYDFDKIKGEYTRNLHRTENGIASVDAILFLKEKERVLFIEFKNGKNYSAKDLCNKMRDSLLIYCDISNEHIRSTRNNAEFVVVFNRNNKPIRKEEILFEQVQESESRDNIKDYLLSKANREYVRWGLEKYIGIYFDAVHTYDQEAFEDFLNGIYI